MNNSNKYNNLMLKRRRKDIDLYIVKKKMSITDNSINTILDFKNLFIPKFIKKCDEYKIKSKQFTEEILKSIDHSDENNIFYKEYLNHLHNGIENHFENGVLFQFNDYVNNYKLTTDRVLLYLYEKTFEELCNEYLTPESNNDKEYYNLEDTDDEENSNDESMDEESMNENASQQSKNNNSKMDIDSPSTQYNTRSKLGKENKIKTLNKILELTKNNLGNAIYKIIFLDSRIISYFNPILEEMKGFCQKNVDVMDNVPFIEQKTPEWFKMRESMISASVCGYLDNSKNTCSLSQETEQIKEKSYLKGKKKFSWKSPPLRHGQQFEDLSVLMYEKIHNCKNKEYGVLPDTEFKFIGASPDGLIVDTFSDQLLKRRKLHRLLEIKNPYSRIINKCVPSQYYWQMQQQNRVCQLPIVDFLETTFKYKNVDYDSFKRDLFDISKLKEIKTYKQLIDTFAPYIIENLDFSKINDKFIKLINNLDILEFESKYVQLIINNFDDVSPFKLHTLSKKGLYKGVLWCFIKELSPGDVDFKIEVFSPDEVLNSIEKISEYFSNISQKHLENGYELEETHFWTCNVYSELEVEYNKGLYESYKKTDSDDDTILKRLTKRWNIIETLRAIENEDLRGSKFTEFYPSCKDKYTEAYELDYSITDDSKSNKNKTTSNNKKIYKKKKSKRMHNSKGHINNDNNFIVDDDYDLS